MFDLFLSKILVLKLEIKRPDTCILSQSEES
jgi:hypothetical protein